MMRWWNRAAPRRPQRVHARHACMINVWSILDWFSKDFGLSLGRNFNSKEPSDKLWDYFQLILGSQRAVGEAVGSLMLENRFQNERAWRRSSILKPKVGLRASDEIPKASRKVSVWAEISIRKSLRINFGIIFSSLWQRAVGKAVGSLLLENRSQNERAWRRHFDTKSQSASLLWASESLPKGVTNRIEIMKSNNHHRTDKFYAFEGGCFVSLHAKMMICSHQIRRSKHQL